MFRERVDIDFFFIEGEDGDDDANDGDDGDEGDNFGYVGRFGFGGFELFLVFEGFEFRFLRGDAFATFFLFACFSFFFFFSGAAFGFGFAGETFFFFDVDESGFDGFFAFDFLDHLGLILTKFLVSLLFLGDRYLQYYQPDKYSPWSFRTMTAADFGSYDRPSEELWGLINGEWVRLAVISITGSGSVSVTTENGATASSGSRYINMPADVWKVKTVMTVPGLKNHTDLSRRIDGVRMNYNVGIRLLASSETGMKGIEEMIFVLNSANALNLNSQVELDVSLARGLNYYTGTILEVKALDVEMGSITGGGRYDNLTGVFGMDGLSGVGISFGADRIFDVLNTLDLYPADTIATTKVIFINFGEKEAAACLQHMAALRTAGISCELFPESAKMKKQMAYANAKGVPFVAMVGESEMESGTISIKNMATGEQNNYTVDQVIELLKQ